MRKSIIFILSEVEGLVAIFPLSVAIFYFLKKKVKGFSPEKSVMSELGI
jgi:hypothetical protein